MISAPAAIASRATSAFDVSMEIGTSVCSRNARTIRALIRELGADGFEQRERARTRLLAYGREAIPYLRQAARDGDTERRVAAQELLRSLGG